MPNSESSATKKLSKIDRNILRILQRDGRISYTDLSREVGLSVTPCIETSQTPRTQWLYRRLHRQAKPRAIERRTGSICTNTPQPHLAREL